MRSIMILLIGIITFFSANCGSVSKNEKVKNDKEYIISVVMEGDSWLDYPFSKDLYDTFKNYAFESKVQNKNQRVIYKIESVGSKGDELLKMVIEFEFVKSVNKRNPDFFLLSGGGNDLLNESVLDSIINTTANSCEQSNKANIDFFVNKNKLNRRIEIIVFGIKIIANELKDIYDAKKEELESLPSERLSIPLEFNTIPMFIHGYDYINVEEYQKNCPILQKLFYKCQWLYPKLKDFDPVIRKRISNHLIDEYNKALENLSNEASFKDKIFYIDLRNTIKSEDWSDEIHPSSKGFKLLSEKIHSSIFTAILNRIKLNEKIKK